MDGAHFDRLTRSLSAGSSRRAIVLRLGGAAVGLTLSPIPEIARAKKRKKPLRFNELGCIHVER